MVCVDLVTLSVFIHKDRSRNQTQAGLKFSKSQINMPATSIQNSFHNTWLARYLQHPFIVFCNAIAGKFKRNFKRMFVQDN
jgi:hypothetical protein